MAPNISEIEDNPITEDMKFIPLDFNTVFSEVHETYKDAGNVISDNFKTIKILEILQKKRTKSLIYAGTFNNIDIITNILKDNLQEKHDEILDSFSDWLITNYSQHYILADIIKKGIGIHNGRLHRSLSQIQVKLFEEEKGLDNIVSTSSIIEGVNTSAENVIIWANKSGKGRAGLNNFTYKNIVGRGGRMFKHFIGKVYLLEPPPQETTQLKLEFTDDLINSLDMDKFRGDLTREQEIKIIAFNDEMDTVLGQGVYSQILKDNSFQTFSPSRLRTIAIDMRNNAKKWNGLVYLNSPNPNDWESNLYLVLNSIGAVGAKYSDMVAYIKIISQNWNRTIPQMLPFLQGNGVTIEKFFEMERDVSFKVATMLKDVNLLYNHIFSNKVDISPFISKISHAFLPKLVYELEEYGLPRMISKKIQLAGIINLENPELPIHEAISQFNQIGLNCIIQKMNDLHPFEYYILEYFYDGIATD